jgi:[ribosomal protein S5]-alanine N-acetyltransferase
MSYSSRLQKLAALIQMSQYDEQIRAHALLQNEVIQLRPFKSDDYLQWVGLRAQSRNFLTPWEGDWAENALDKQYFEDLINRYAHEAEHGQSYYFAVVRKADQVIMGGVQVADIKRGSFQSGYLGYWIGANFSRKGVMSEAMTLLLSYAFLHLKLHRTEALVHPANHASIGLLEKFRFICEGMVRSSVYLDGIWQDHWLYSFLESDFLTYFLG